MLTMNADILNNCVVVQFIIALQLGCPTALRRLRFVHFCQQIHYL